MKKGHEFWESLYNQEAIVFHALVPTVLTTCLGDMEKFSAKVIHDMLRKERTCVHCNRFAKKGDIVSFLCRIIITKVNCDPDCFSYATYVHVALACQKCAIRQEYSRLSSNSTMQETFYLFVRSLGRRVNALSSAHDLTGEQVFGRLVNQFESPYFYKLLLKKLSKADKVCLYCKKNDAHYICVGCHFRRFCNDECAKGGWPLHKPECKIFRKSNQFLGIGKIIKIK
jgi:hypothetical protein